MNKNGLIAAVAEKCGIAKKEAAEVVEATLDIILLKRVKRFR